MLSKTAVAILDWTFVVTGFMKIHPYEWDLKTRTLTVTKSNRVYFTWLLVVFLTYTHTSWIFFRQFQSWFFPDMTTSKFLFQVFFVLASHLGSMIMGQTYFRLYETADFITKFMQFDQRNTDIYQQKKVVRMDVLTFTMLIFLIQGPANLIGIVSIFLNNPYQTETWFVSLIDGDRRHFKAMVFLELFWHMYVWGGIFLFVMPTFAFLCTTTQWIQQLRNRHDDSIMPVKKLTIPAIREQKTVIQLYRSFELLTIGYNESFAFLTLPQQNMNSMIMMSTCLYGSVQFYGKISFEAYLIFPSTLFGIYIYSSVLFNFSAAMNGASIEFIHSWIFSGAINKAMTKFIKSCAGLRIHVGFFFMIQRHTFVTYMSNIFNFAINLLLSF